MKKQRLFDIRHKKTCNVLILQVLQEVLTDFDTVFVIRLGTLSDPAGIRTQDPNIKSVVLYQLSY